jgi:hypothetical protein
VSSDLGKKGEELYHSLTSHEIQTHSKVDPKVRMEDTWWMHKEGTKDHYPILGFQE